MDADVFRRAGLVLVLVTLPVTSLLAAHNAAEWRLQPAVARQKRPVLLYTTALASMAALAATLAFAAPRRTHFMEAPTEDGVPFSVIALQVSSSGLGVAAVLFGALALIMDQHFTLVS